ncbi:hypothetical protein VTH06DRAFT_8677 [Thermothelomyces fergusii]
MTTSAAAGRCDGSRDNVDLPNAKTGRLGRPLECSGPLDETRARAKCGNSRIAPVRMPKRAVVTGPSPNQDRPGDFTFSRQEGCAGAKVFPTKPETAPTKPRSTKRTPKKRDLRDCPATTRFPERGAS